MSSNVVKMATVAILFVGALVFFSTGATASSSTLSSSDFAGGDGTKENPYIIETPAQLDKVRNYLDAHFRLEADIDLSHYSDGEGWDPIASGFNTSNPDTLFTGSFDGNGFTISNLTIDREEDCQGLFAAVGEEGEIRDVHLEDVTINGGSCVGSLVGLNYGVIENASVNFGLVNGDDFVGGLVGRHSGELVSSHADISVFGQDYVGGLVGYMNGFNHKTVSIRDSYASGNVDGKTVVGGLVGRIETDNAGSINEIMNSYAEGKVTGDKHVGGFIGSNAVLPGGTIIVRNSYATGDVTGQSQVGGLIGYNVTTSGSDTTFVIAQNYVTGKVTGPVDDTINGFIGENYFRPGSDIIVENNFWVKDHYTDPIPDNGYGTPVTWEELSDPDTFGDWDFSDGWYQYDGEFPFHHWQNPLISWDVSIAKNVLELGQTTEITVHTKHEKSEYDATTTATYTVDREIVHIDQNGTVVPLKGGQATITVSLFGNAEQLDIVVDTGKPEPPTITLVPDGWTKASEVKVTIDHEAKDHQKADVKTIRIKVGDGEWDDYAFAGEPVIFKVTEEGQTSIQAQAVDEIGNVSDMVEKTVKISRSGLRLESKLHLTSDDQQLYSSGTWTNQSVTAVVYASHDQGLAFGPVEYSVDEGDTWEIYENPLVFSNDGQFPLWFTVKDIAGNELDGQVMIRIDGTKPVIQFDPEGNDDKKKSVSSRVSVMDYGSGVDENSLHYIWSTSERPLDEHAGWQPFQNNSTLTHTDDNDGDWYLHIRAADRAGNESYEISKRFRLENEKRNQYIPSNIADLSELNFDGVLLTPEFSNHITEYRGQVGHETDQIELTLRAAHPFATIEINGERIGKEQEPISIPLNDELQTIEIVVTAENGTKKTYTIMIEREQAEEDDSELPIDPYFSDIEGHWAERSIMEAALKGWIKGYPDQTFKPDAPVTRAKFLVMLARALNWEGEGVTLGFRDKELIGAWAEQAIAQAVESGIIIGYEDGSFRPGKAITRLEIAIIIAKILEVNLTESTLTSFADDANIPSWGKPYVEALWKLGIFNGRDGNRFEANEATTRAEAVIVLFRLLKRQEL
jgi:Cadherin-like beta sandwich domain/S-layer homology domain